MDLPSRMVGTKFIYSATGLRSESINIIVDHGTSPFAGSLAEPTELRSRDLAKIYLNTRGY